MKAKSIVAAAPGGRPSLEKQTYIDIDELTVRIAEACIGVKRPKGRTAEEAFRELRAMDPVFANGFSRAALAAATYIAECCNANYPGSVEVKQVTLTGAKAIS